MSAYVVVNAKIADMEKYRANFQKAAQALHDRLGAKMLARTDQPVMIAGKHNGGRMVLLEFANTAKAREWWAAMEKEMPDKDNMSDHNIMILEGIHA